MSEMLIMEKRVVRASVVLYPYIIENLSLDQNNRLFTNPFTTFFSFFLGVVCPG